MKRYAVDIVLVPPDRIVTEAIKLNKQLIENNPPKIELNKEYCVPHISLSMGVLNESDTEQFIRELEKIAGKHKALQLSSAGIYAVKIASGEHVSGIAVENTDELQALHNDVMELNRVYLSNDATGDMVYSPPPVEEVTLHFINNYPLASAYENFRPHITLGVGEMMNADYREDFTASKLALFHLGNYCTCRKIIHHFSL